jgi:hypothetical protein
MIFFIFFIFFISETCIKWGFLHRGAFVCKKRVDPDLDWEYTLLLNMSLSKSEQLFFITE